jgi:hypothetical protein
MECTPRYLTASMVDPDAESRVVVVAHKLPSAG